MDKKTTVQITQASKDALAKMGVKNDSYEVIIMRMFHQRNILMIHHFFKHFDGGDFADDDVMKNATRCFSECNIPAPSEIFDGGLNGTQEMIPFTTEHFIHCCEMASDEDLTGSSADSSMAELVTNVYCLAWDIPAPTWSMGLKNPFGTTL